MFYVFHLYIPVNTDITSLAIHMPHKKFMSILSTTIQVNFFIWQIGMKSQFMSKVNLSLFNVINIEIFFLHKWEKILCGVHKIRSEISVSVPRATLLSATVAIRYLAISCLTDGYLNIFSNLLYLYHSWLRNRCIFFNNV